MGNSDLKLSRENPIICGRCYNYDYSSNFIPGSAINYYLITFTATRQDQNINT